MKLKAEEEKFISDNIKEYINHPSMGIVKKSIQHADISTYEHCLNVTRVSLRINRKLRLRSDEVSLVHGAFLHDYYLYDWHDGTPYNKLHGYHHADYACSNAKRNFNINDKEQAIIKCHMWPLNITRFPKNREAMIVTMADKYCSTLEVLRLRTITG